MTESNTPNSSNQQPEDSGVASGGESSPPKRRLSLRKEESPAEPEEGQRQESVGEESESKQSAEDPHGTGDTDSAETSTEDPPAKKISMRLPPKEQVEEPSAEGEVDPGAWDVEPQPTQSESGPSLSLKKKPAEAETAPETVEGIGQEESPAEGTPTGEQGSEEAPSASSPSKGPPVKIRGLSKKPFTDSGAPKIPVEKPEVAKTESPVTPPPVSVQKPEEATAKAPPPPPPTVPVAAKGTLSEQEAPPPTGAGAPPPVVVVAEPEEKTGTSKGVLGLVVGVLVLVVIAVVVVLLLLKTFRPEGAEIAADELQTAAEENQLEKTGARGTEFGAEQKTDESEEISVADSDLAKEEVQLAVSEPIVPEQPIGPVSDPDVAAFIDNMVIKAVRGRGSSLSVMIDQSIHRLNQVVNHELNVRLVGIDPQTSELVFEDANGYIYYKPY